MQLVAERHKLYLALLRVILLNQRVVGTLRVEVVDGRFVEEVGDIEGRVVVGAVLIVDENYFSISLFSLKDIQLIQVIVGEDKFLMVLAFDHLLEVLLLGEVVDQV